jgi:hypothetical protein
VNARLHVLERGCVCSRVLGRWRVVRRRGRLPYAVLWSADAGAHTAARPLLWSAGGTGERVVARTARRAEAQLIADLARVAVGFQRRLLKLGELPCFCGADGRPSRIAPRGGPRPRLVRGRRRITGGAA